MKAQNFSLQEYLYRIHYSGDLNKSLDTVNKLMLHQLRHVPFENIDVLNGKGVSLQPEHIVEKIVHQQRGGYCFELNGLFAMVLAALGIPYHFIAARPMVYQERRPKTHMVLVLEIDNALWLCDLGYGRFGIRQLINLNDLEKVIQQTDDHFMLHQDTNGIYHLKASIDGEWFEQLEFDLTPQQWIDFIPVNYYTATSPDSIFVNQLIVILFTENGRKILNGDTLKIFNHGHLETRKIGPNQIKNILETEFGLTA